MRFEGDEEEEEDEDEEQQGSRHTQGSLNDIQEEEEEGTGGERHAREVLEQFEEEEEGEDFDSVVAERGGSSLSSRTDVSISSIS